MLCLEACSKLGTDDHCNTSNLPLTEAKKGGGQEKNVLTVPELLPVLQYIPEENRGHEH